MEAELTDDQFKHVRSLALRFTKGINESEVREDLVKFLDTLEPSQQAHPAVSSLCIQAGLFPYILPETVDTLSEREILRYEYHRLDYENDGFVCHSAQADIYHRLMDGKSVILSAPTSFGKTKILDLLLLSRKWAKVVIIVPTIALIDELRTRISGLKIPHRIFTHPEHAKVNEYVYILTQERFLQLEGIEVDFFFMDEFYLLDPSRKDESYRSMALNITWKRLERTGAQYYLCAPLVEGLNDGLPIEIKNAFIKSDFAPVYVEVEDRSHVKDKQRLDDLRGIWPRFHGEQKLVYVSSPKSARTVADEIASFERKKMCSSITELFARWLAEHYHPEWSVVKALRHGIGIHTGTLPRSINRLMVNLFSAGELETLVCTSTLIRGVNTSAKNVIVFDKKIGKNKMDYFDFRNLAGRSGRMKIHLIGRVITYLKSPENSDYTINIPIETASEDSDPEMWMRAELEDRINEYEHNIYGGVLTASTYSKNYNISRELQDSVANSLLVNPGVIDAMRFNGFRIGEDLFEKNT